MERLLLVAFVLGVGWYIGRYERMPVQVTMAWLSAVATLMLVGGYIAAGFLAWAADLAGFLLFISMVVSQRVSKMWMRIVMGWNDDWLRGALPPAEATYYAKLTRIVATVQKVEMRRYRASADTGRDALASTLRELERLEPPNIHWRGVHLDVRDHVAALKAVYDTEPVDSSGALEYDPAVDAELYTRWCALKERLLAVRNRRTILYGRR